MVRKEKAGGEAWWGGSRDGEFSFEHSEVDKPETYPSRCVLRLLLTQVWSLGVIAQPETHIFGLLVVGKEEGVGCMKYVKENMSEKKKRRSRAQPS